MNTKRLLKNLVIWRISLLIIALLGIQLLPFKDAFPYRQELLQPLGHPLFYSWANFDGVHYLTIARSGYLADFTQAFFPFYPYLIRFINPIFNNYLTSGLIISHISLFLALILLYRLILLDYPKKTANKTLILLLSFPTAFYFGSLYTESLYLLLSVGAFYIARIGNVTGSALYAGIASSTRVIGAFLAPALFLEWFDLSSLKKFPKKRLLILALALIIAISGLLFYMYFLHRNYSDSLYFLHSQPAFGASRSSDRIILLYQVFYRYARMVVTVDRASLTYFTLIQELTLSSAFLGLILASFKRMRPSYVLYSILAFLTPTLTGTFSSMPRYVLVIFPLFIFFAHHAPPRLYRFWLVISLILLAINTILFTRGYWVA